MDCGAVFRGGCFGGSGFFLYIDGLPYIHFIGFMYGKRGGLFHLLWEKRRRKVKIQYFPVLCPDWGSNVGFNRFGFCRFGNDYPAASGSGFGSSFDA